MHKWDSPGTLVGEHSLQIDAQQREQPGLLVANIKSQIKRNKTNDARHERNKAVKSGLKTSIRQVNEAVAAGDASKAAEAAKVACRQLDKAVSKGVIHKNQAANRKSAVASAAAGVGK